MKKRFTLMELLIVIAIIAILFSMIFPAFKKARHSAAMTACLGNLKQINTASFGYLMDNDKRFPNQVNGADLHQGRNWVGKLGKGIWGKNVTERPMNAYLGYTADNVETPLTHCPLNSLGEEAYHSLGSNYVGNAFGLWNGLKNKRMSAIKQPSVTVVFTEIGGMTYLYDGNKKWWRMNHGRGKPLYPYLNGDGSAFQFRPGPGGEGKKFGSTKVNVNLNLL